MTGVRHRSRVGCLIGVNAKAQQVRIVGAHPTGAALFGIIEAYGHGNVIHRHPAAGYAVSPSVCVFRGTDLWITAPVLIERITSFRERGEAQREFVAERYV